ncbi:MAG: diphthine--ammonia ligase [Clostridium sp.]
MKNFVISYSCGKDSTLALYRMIKDGYNPIAMIVTFYEDDTRSWLHGVSEDLLDQISKSLNIPIIKSKHNSSNYESAFENALKIGKEMGADTCVFGDIDIMDHKQWGINRCSVAGLSAHYPLWQENRKKLTHEFIDSGFSAIVKAVSKQYKLNKSILGMNFTKSLVNDIEKTGADACGENGEYHTFVYNGPLFQKEIRFNAYGIVDSQYSFAINIW